MLTTPEAREDYKAFAARHGGSPVFDGGRLLFPDGAECSDSDTIRMEPPRDPARALRRRRRYLTAKVRQTEGDLSRLAAALQGTGPGFKWPEGTYGPPPQTGPAALAFLEALHAEEVRALAGVERQIAALPHPA